MKIRHFTGLLLALFIFASCTPVDIFDDIPADEAAEYEIISDQTYDFEEFVSNMMNGSSITSGLPDIYKTLITAAVSSYFDGLKDDNGLKDSKLGFRRIAYSYQSEDQYGNPVTLSAMALWTGGIDGEEWKDIAPDKISLVEHFTITSNEECPSEGYPFEAFINGNALVIMPDYIGYGVSSDMIHPYMNHGLCALNSIDALSAGAALFDELSSAGMDKGWKLYVLGASQGGGNALAVHKMMDTDEQLSSKWRFAGSYCAVGPYDPSLTVDRYMEAGRTDHPVLFPLTLYAMQDSYPEILGKYDDSDLFSDKYITRKSEIDAALKSKEYSTSRLNGMLVDFLRNPSGTPGLGADELLLEDILSPVLLDKDSEVCTALYKCLEMNDLTQGWAPQHPIRLYYSEVDKVVPCDNALAVYEAFGEEKVTLVKGLQMDHGSSCAMWMLDVLTSGIQF